jgi:hypothetical protein
MQHLEVLGMVGMDKKDKSLLLLDADVDDALQVTEA